MVWLLSSILQSVTAHASFSFLPPDGDTIAPMFDHLYEFMVIICSIASILVIGGMIYFALKYRRRPGQKSAYITHNTMLEFLWSFIPFVLFMVAFGWGWYVYFHMRTVPKKHFEVNVIAQQWLWSFEYNSGRIEARNLYVPVNTPIELIMTSKDVIHSFFVPAFRQKQDVVPGTYTYTWFDATHVGTYDLFCTQFCGVGHSSMLGKVHVLTKVAFDHWLEANPNKGLTPVEIGHKIYEQRCSVCHNITTQPKIGPGWAHLYGSMVQLQGQPPHRADANYIRTHILTPARYTVKGFPKGVMPSFQGQLTETQINGIIAFIKSLK